MSEVLSPLTRSLQHLLNKVNRVTAAHRHGNPVRDKDLTMLANAQVEYEEAIREAEKNESN